MIHALVCKWCMTAETSANLNRTTIVSHQIKAIQPLEDGKKDVLCQITLAKWEYTGEVSNVQTLV